MVANRPIITMADCMPSSETPQIDMSQYVGLYRNLIPEEYLDDGWQVTIEYRNGEYMISACRYEHLAKVTILGHLVVRDLEDYVMGWSWVISTPNRHERSLEVRINPKSAFDLATEAFNDLLAEDTTHNKEQRHGNAQDER